MRTLLLDLKYDEVVALRAIWCGCFLAGALLAGDTSVSIADFDGAVPLARWSVSKDGGAEGAIAVGSGHSGKGAVLNYQFRGGGSVSAVWTPEKPVPFKHKGAVSMWIRATPAVKITVVLTDKSEGVRRYPFEPTSLERPSGSDWREVVVPLAAKSTGYWDEDHNGAPKGRMVSLGILAEARFPMEARGNISFDDVRVMESPDQTVTLNPAAELAPAPPRAAQLGPRLGVNIHVLNDEPGLDAARDAGFGFVRADLLWAQAERNGRYRFGAYDRLLAALTARGMGALWILDYGHPQHGGGPPRTPEDIAAFARFAEATAAHFKGGNVRYEVWNEPDTERFWQPAPNVREYATLLRDAVAAIHRADPAAPVASGGLSRMDLPFLQGIVKADAASGLNAAAIHPYRRQAPETLASELPLLRILLSAGPGEKVQIWDTEWGYASYDYFSKNLKGDGHSPAGRDRQAVLAVREALTVWALGLPTAVWYDLRDDGDDAKNPEHNYGLLDAKGADKPAMKALRELARTARDHTYAGLIRDVPDGAHLMVLQGAKDKVYIAWSDQPDSHITVRLPGAIQSVTNLTGDPLKLKNGELPLPETGGPVYIRVSN